MVWGLGLWGVYVKNKRKGRPVIIEKETNVGIQIKSFVSQIKCFRVGAGNRFT
jgi:hypothetical protein